MSFTFSLDTDIDPVTANIPVQLNVSIPPDTIDNDYVGVIYHECTVHKQVVFLNSNIKLPKFLLQIMIIILNFYLIQTYYQR